MNVNLKKTVVAAVFAAFACVATMSIRIPTPGTGGYIHPGDAVVILAGAILGPGMGFLASGVGSAIADLLGGYFFYVPITFAIKGAVACASGMIFRKLGRTPKSRCAAVALGGICDILLVAGGYFVCEIPMYGVAGAASSVPANLFQGASGLVLGLLLYPFLFAVPDIRQMAREAGAHA